MTELNKYKMPAMGQKVIPGIKFMTLMSFPLLSMLPVGNLLYISSTLFCQIVMTKFLKSQFIMRALNVPVYLKGTKSEQD